MPPVLQSVMRFFPLCVLTSVSGRCPHQISIGVISCIRCADVPLWNAFVRFGTAPALDFHWRNLLYQSIWSTVRTSIVIGEIGTAAGFLFRSPGAFVCSSLSFVTTV